MNKEADKKILEDSFRNTRKSLIANLGDWGDQKVWDDFYKTYWKVIYSTSLKSGLSSEEAFDCVQETILSIAKQSKKNMYDCSKGSFKSWLMNMTRWRIKDQLRKRFKHSEHISDFNGDDENDSDSPRIERYEDPRGDVLERLWQAEWSVNLMDMALIKVKNKVSPEQYQIFDYYVLKNWKAKRVQEYLDVSMAQVYLSKHRVQSLLKKELATLREDEEE